MCYGMSSVRFYSSHVTRATRFRRVAVATLEKLRFDNRQLRELKVDSLQLAVQVAIEESEEGLIHHARIRNVIDDYNQSRQLRGYDAHAGGFSLLIPIN